MAMGSHDYEDDPRNADILISVNGELKPRREAMISVFDAGFVLGDGVGRACASMAVASLPDAAPGAAI